MLEEVREKRIKTESELWQRYAQMPTLREQLAKKAYKLGLGCPLMAEELLQNALFADE